MFAQGSIWRFRAGRDAWLTMAVILPLVLSGGDTIRPSSAAGLPTFSSGDRPESGDYYLQSELRISLLPPLDVVVTAYSSTVGQTDDTPFLTASLTDVRPGIIALSRDLIRRYTPDAPFAYGDRVFIKGQGIFVVEDTMNKRYSRRADIWFPSRDEAIQFGRKELTIAMVTGDIGSLSGFSHPVSSAPSK